MPVVIALAGFLGAWLLVAGPIYQAAFELDSEQVDRAGIEAADRAVPPSRPMSPWWWLLPPVAVVRQRRETSRRRRLLMLRVLDADQVAQLLGFGAKATGWLLVACGGALIATKETWELVELLEWPPAAFLALIVGALLVSLLYAVGRLRRDHRMLDAKRAMLQETAAAS